MGFQIMKLLKWLVDGVVIAVPAGIITGILTLLLAPIIAIFPAIGIISVAVGFIVLGWWAPIVIKRFRLLGG